jgi:hypothetical protein
MNWTNSFITSGQPNVNQHVLQFFCYSVLLCLSVAAGACLPNRCPAMDYSASIRYSGNVLTEPLPSSGHTRHSILMWDWIGQYQVDNGKYSDLIMLRRSGYSCSTGNTKQGFVMIHVYASLWKKCDTWSWFGKCFCHVVKQLVNVNELEMGRSAACRRLSVNFV